MAAFAGVTSRSARHSTVVRTLATAAPSASTPRLRTDKRAGDISDVFTSFSGKKAEPLPDRYKDLKRNLTAGLEEQLQKSWDDLVEVLKVRTEEVAQKRESVSTFPSAPSSQLKVRSFRRSISEMSQVVPCQTKHWPLCARRASS
jgi:hypothetical protein